MIKENDFIKIVTKGKNFPTVISFSSLNTKKGDFKPYKLLLNEKINIIFVNCDGNNYYQNGIEGISEDPKIVADQLVSAAREIGNGRVVTFGTSMGAYGAILHCILGNADGCLAFGPPIDLKIPEGRSMKYIDPNIEIVYPDLTDLVSNSSMPIVVYASEHDELDLMAAKKIMHFINVEVMTVRGTNHPGIRTDLIKGWLSEFASKGVYCREFDRKGNMLNDTASVQLNYELYCEKQRGNTQVYLNKINELLKPNNFMSALRLAEMEAGNENLISANEFYINAIKLNEYCYEAYDALAESPRIEADQKITYLKKSLEIFPNANIHAKIGKLHFSNNDLGLAETSYKKALGYMPNNTRIQGEYNKVKESLVKIG